MFDSHETLKTYRNLSVNSLSIAPVNVSLSANLMMNIILG